MAILVDERHEARRPGPHRAARARSTGCATASTAPTWSPASRPARAGRTSRACRSSTPSTRRSPRPAPTPSMVFVPPPFAADAIYEAADAGIATIICITEGIPAHDMLRVYNYLQRHRLAADRPQLPGRALAGQGERRASSPRTSSPRAASAWCRARARSPTRSATSWPSSASATRRSSASAATRSSAARSST